MDSELETMKREINIADVAADYGYSLDKRGSCRASLLMRNEAQASKIVIATSATDGHSIFFEVHGAAAGSVLDFVMWQSGLNLGHARKLLRERLHAPASTPRLFKPVPTTISTARLYADWQAFASYAPGYLEQRGVTQETIALFASEVRTDQRGNTVFRHRDRLSHLCGWEVKNAGFTGFSTGGQKGLFLKLVGTPGTPPNTIIVAESAIDAMSFCQIQGLDGLYVSFAGGLSEIQIQQLAQTLARYPAAHVQIATDNDDQGEIYAALLCNLRPDAHRARPAAKDWNEMCQGKAR
ncbi:MAG: toprim domain-containing protein [Ktedonobacteraceae bacterium]